MRKCGTCRACCTSLIIDELNKPGFTPCPHECEQGCGIYAQRPGCCRSFQCLWLQGHLGEDDRPDRLGVIFTATTHPDHAGTLPMLVEHTPDALQTLPVREAVARLRQMRPVVVLSREGRAVLPKTGRSGRQGVALPVVGSGGSPTHAVAGT